jgi:hypothetical protein
MKKYSEFDGIEDLFDKIAETFGVNLINKTSNVILKLGQE